MRCAYCALRTCSEFVGRNKRSALRRFLSNTLAEVARHRHIARPIFRKQSRPYVAVERGMWPVADAADEAVLDRIDIAILDVAAKILIVADQMFLEAALPDGPFAARDADRATLFGVGNGLGEA